MLPKAPWVLPAAYTLMAIAQPNLMYDRLDIGLMMFLLLLFMLADIVGLPSPDRWGLRRCRSPAADLWAGASYLFLGPGNQFQDHARLSLCRFCCWPICGRLAVWKFAGRVLCLLVAALGPFLVYVPSAGSGVLSLFRITATRHD